MLGFYAYLPDIRVWVRMQPHFPYKNYLLEFDAQTLQLLVFTFLLFLILFKVYYSKTSSCIKIKSFLLSFTSWQLFGIVMVT